MAESYVQRWARERAEQNTQKEKSDVEKGVGPGEQNARSEGQTPKKNKTRRKNA